jgi:excisionase family DNA binding protein
MELLSVGDVAGKLRVSSRQIWKMLASGRIPAPVRLGRSVRFRAADIARWVELGCPSRDRLEAEQGVRPCR